MVDPSVVAVFIEESSDLVQRALVASVRLEMAASSQHEELMQDIARALHTLKGSAGSSQLAVGADISRRVHGMEDSLLGASGLDVPARAVALITELAWVEEQIGRVAAGAHEIASDDADSTGPDVGLGRPVPGIEGLFLFDDEPEPTPAPTVSTAPSGGEGSRALQRLRVAPERINATHELASELMISRLNHDAIVSEVTALRDDVAKAALAFRTMHTLLREHRTEAPELWWEVEAPLARMHTDLSKLRDASMRIARRSTSHRDRTGSLIGALEASVRTLRVMPLQPFLEELLPVARHACAHRDVRVRVVVDGGGAEADRQVLMALREPLLHLVRNAVAHGVGSTARRAADGRDPTGTIRVTAKCLGPRLHIVVEDDGYGIDTEIMARRGRELGVLSANATLDDRTLLAVLAAPGVSTADATDALAGRGVGMNVALDTVERLGGRVVVAANPGTGAAFRLDVPIAIAATKGLVVACDGARFGLPLGQIERVVRVRREDLRGSSGSFVSIGDEPVSVACLGDFVGCRPTQVTDDWSDAIVARAHGVRLALLVDDIPGQVELIVRPLPAVFSDQRFVTGGAVQADSSVLLVLDLPAIVSCVQKNGASRAHLQQLEATA